MKLELPERCQVLRTIACELSRITDHLTCVGASAMELGAFTPFLYLMKAREELYFCIDRLTGARVTTSYTRIGGVKADMPPDFPERVVAAFRVLRESVKDTEALLTRNRIFVDRLKGVGVLDKETALAYGVTGPLLRSAGVPYDVRRARPYLVYDRLDFEVPVGTTGDNLDRYLVRLAEIEQSLRIVEQCFDRLPPGPVAVPDAQLLDAGLMADLGKRGKTGHIFDARAGTDPVLEGSGEAEKPLIAADQPDSVLPPKEEVYNSIEGLMRHFEIVMPSRGIVPPPGEAYAAVEGGNGELGFHVVSDGRSRPWRVRVRPPCFFNMAVLHKLLVGSTVADVVATFGSINMIAGELDR
ncbi:MAG TPA: NADH-quinone oxidoreductase subunit D [Elusimicrobia bacterium]|nr:NADH-quinone oxidoreductase subunit D [Elusimicrobiota bacterium]